MSNNVLVIAKLKRVVNGDASFAVGDSNLAVPGEISKIEMCQTEDGGVESIVFSVFVKHENEEKIYIEIPFHAVTRWMYYGKE